MLIYGLGDLRQSQIPEIELMQIGVKLKRFVELYRKNLVIKVPNGDNQDSEKILNTLEDIANKILEHRYDELFDDTRIVDVFNDTIPF